jgi:hypothetical protein
MSYFGILLAFVSSWEAVKNQTYKEQTSRAKKMLSTGSGEYTMISHLGLAANQLITSNVARAFFSRTVRLWRRLVETMRFPMTSSMSRTSSMLLPCREN